MLIVLEGIAVVAMLLMACAVLLLVVSGAWAAGRPAAARPLCPDLRRWRRGHRARPVVRAAFLRGLRAGRDLGRGSRKVQVHHPSRPDRHRPGRRRRVHPGDRGRDAWLRHRSRRRRRFTKSTSLLADLSARYFGGWSGRPVRRLAICSALGGALASIVAASRILFALCRDMFPSSPMARISQASGTPRDAAVCVVVAAIVGYLILRIVFRASGSDAFFWGSTLGALALLVAYLLVVISAAGALLRPSGGTRWLLFIPRARGPGDRLHAVGERLPAAARRLSGNSMAGAGVVLRAGDRDAPASPAARAGGIRLPGDA